MHWISPRARAGLNMFEASSEPEAPPAPTIVCSSSMKRMMSAAFSSSFITAFMRSSNWPRYLVPATRAARSSVTTRLLCSTRETFFCTMRRASPSAIAVLPTPGSPMSTGLFFLRRESTWATRSISFSRPTIGSSLSSMASLVRSRPKLSSTGVLAFSPRRSAPCPLPAPGVWPEGASPFWEPCEGLPLMMLSSSLRTLSYCTVYCARIWAAMLSSSRMSESSRCSVPITSDL
jgi:hypothetical protein